MLCVAIARPWPWRFFCLMARTGSFDKGNHLTIPGLGRRVQTRPNDPKRSSLTTENAENFVIESETTRRGELARLACRGACCDVASGMSVTIQLDLPEALVNEAKANGLLESRRLGEMLNEELRRERARKDLGRMLKDLHSLPGEPMSPDEIQAEIDAVRAQRRQRESGH